MKNKVCENKHLLMNDRSKQSSRNTCLDTYLLYADDNIQSAGGTA
jgi:hypothetical protein